MYMRSSDIHVYITIIIVWNCKRIPLELVIWDKDGMNTRAWIQKSGTETELCGLYDDVFVYSLQVWHSRNYRHGRSDALKLDYLYCHPLPAHISLSPSLSAAATTADAAVLHTCCQLRAWEMQRSQILKLGIPFQTLITCNLTYLKFSSLLLPPPSRLCFQRRLLVCLIVLAELRKTIRKIGLHKIWWKCAGTWAQKWREN